MESIISIAQEACGVTYRGSFSRDDQVRTKVKNSIANWDEKTINEILEMEFSLGDGEIGVIIKQMCVMELMKRSVDKGEANDELIDRIAELVVTPIKKYNDGNRNLKLEFVLESIKDAIYQDHTDRNLRNNEELIGALQGCCIQIFARNRDNVMHNMEVNGLYVDNIYESLRDLEFEGRKAPKINSLREAKKYARDMRKEGKDKKEIAEGLREQASLFCIKQLSDELKQPDLLNKFGEQSVWMNVLDAFIVWASKLFQKDDKKEAQLKEAQNARKNWAGMSKEDAGASRTTGSPR